MKLRKFQAATMHEAVANIRRELGPEAVVIATRNVPRGLLGQGVEVTVALEAGAGDTEAPSSAAPESGPGHISDADVERIMAPLRSELRALRTVLRPASIEQSDLRRALVALRESLEGRTDVTAPAPPAAVTPAIEEISLAGLAASATIAAPSQKRVVALVGPTGVGKTTTIAKLAARSALVERRSVALITLDTLRVGGEEQMRIYADLIGVPLTVVAEPARLHAAVEAAAFADLVYIDTAGRSPRDTEALPELELAFAGIADLEVHLVFAAASSPRGIDAVVRRHRSLGVDRLLFTKLDEAEELSELVRAPARHGKPVSFITAGQRVPEDIEDCTAARLLELAQSGMPAAQAAA